MKYTFYKYGFFSLLLFFKIQVVAQVDDNRGWFSISGNTEIKKGWSVAITPILRLDEDISALQNFSLDYSVKKSINKNLSVAILGRSWWVPNQTNRQFFWINVVYNLKLKDVNWNHRVRWHHAFDIKERVDPDFIRYAQVIRYTGLGKFQPALGFESWWGLNEEISFDRIRYIVGFRYNFTKKLHVNAFLWRQETIDRQPRFTFNVIRVGLVYKFPPIWKEDKR